VRARDDDDGVFLASTFADDGFADTLLKVTSSWEFRAFILQSSLSPTHACVCDVVRGPKNTKFPAALLGAPLLGCETNNDRHHANR
jgi:hypothetical protein